MRVDAARKNHHPLCLEQLPHHGVVGAGYRFGCARRCAESSKQHRLYGHNGFFESLACHSLMRRFHFAQRAGGFYVVPLFALLQERAAHHERARVIAANNILNALFMIASALLIMAAYALGPRCFRFSSF